MRTVLLLLDQPVQVKDIAIEKTPAVAPGRVVEEGRIFARYLLGGREPAPEILERYVLACARLVAAPAASTEEAVNAFALRHRWALPCLDALVGFVAPSSLLRQKLVIVLALLETHPAHIGVFAARVSSRRRLLARVLLAGGVNLIQALIGLVLYPVARRAR